MPDGGYERRDARGERPSVDRDRAAVRALVACYGEHNVCSLGWASTDEHGVRYDAKTREHERAELLLLADDGALVTVDDPSGRWTYFVCPCGELLESIRDDTGRDSRSSFPNEIARTPDEPCGPVVACAACASRPTAPPSDDFSASLEATARP